MASRNAYKVWNFSDLIKLEQAISECGPFPCVKTNLLADPFHMRVCSAFNVIFVQIKLIFDERLRTRPRFETEV